MSSWKVHDRAQSFILCMSYVTKTFLLVSCSLVSIKQLLCFVHSQSQKSEQKHSTKNLVRLQFLFIDECARTCEMNIIEPVLQKQLFSDNSYLLVYSHVKFLCDK